MAGHTQRNVWLIITTGLVIGTILGMAVTQI